MRIERKKREEKSLHKEVKLFARQMATKEDVDFQRFHFNERIKPEESQQRTISMPTCSLVYICVCLCLRAHMNTARVNYLSVHKLE